MNYHRLSPQIFIDTKEAVTTLGPKKAQITQNLESYLAGDLSIEAIQDLCAQAKRQRQVENARENIRAWKDKPHQYMDRIILALDIIQGEEDTLV